VEFFLEGCAAVFQGQHLGGEICDAIGGFFDAEAAGVNVGD